MWNWQWINQTLNQYVDCWWQYWTPVLCSIFTQYWFSSKLLIIIIHFQSPHQGSCPAVTIEGWEAWSCYNRPFSQYCGMWHFNLKAQVYLIKHSVGSGRALKSHLCRLTGTSLHYAYNDWLFHSCTPSNIQSYWCRWRSSLPQLPAPTQPAPYVCDLTKTLCSCTSWLRGTQGL